MIAAAIIMLLSIYGFTKISKTTVRIASSLVLLIFLFYAYLFSVKVNRTGNPFESFLYKVKIAPSELFKTKIDRENHKDLWDHWRGYEAKRALALMYDNPSSYVVGCGYGSLVNLKFHAPLSPNPKDKGMKFISELHNGFIYLFYKLGLLGVVIYLYFLVVLYLNIFKKYKFTTVFLSAIGLVFLFTSFTITGIYNTKDCIVLLAGALLFYNEQQPKLTPND